MLDPRISPDNVRYNVAIFPEPSDSSEPATEPIESSEPTESSKLPESSDSSESDSSEPTTEPSESTEPSKPPEPAHTSSFASYMEEKRKAELKTFFKEKSRENNSSEKEKIESDDGDGKKLKDPPKISLEELKKFVYDDRQRLPENLLERKEMLDGFIFYFEEFEDFWFLVLSRALSLFFDELELLGTIKDSKEKESGKDTLKTSLRQKLKELYKLPCANNAMKRELKALFFLVFDNEFLIKQLRCFSAGMMLAEKIPLNPDFISSDSYETRSNKQWAKLYCKLQRGSLTIMDVYELKEFINRKMKTVQSKEKGLCEIDRNYFNLRFPSHSF